MTSRVGKLRIPILAISHESRPPLPSRQHRRTGPHPSGRYRFSPRLADAGGTRFWRIDPKADYGALNAVSAHHLSMRKLAPHWDDMLRLAASLKLGRVPATGIMRTLQVGDRPTRLSQAIAEFGRIDKTLHMLTYIDDDAKRRATLT